MSAKWRALQHRHRYAYTAILFPQDYAERLNSLPFDISSLTFFTELKELVSLSSIYSQVDHVKKVASAFGELLGSSEVEEYVVFEAARFYLEILFIENSLPLHRTMVSALAKSRKFQDVIASCFRVLIDQYGVPSGKGKRFSVSRVALSLMNCPKLGFLVEVVEEFAVWAALDIGVGLSGMVFEVNDGSRPSPVVMEQCQEALSCLYYLLQRFPSKFIDSNSCFDSVIPEGSSILEFLVKAILSILKSSAFSRDCLVAAGVSFFAALQVQMKPEELSYFIVTTIFCHSSRKSIIGRKSENGNMDGKLLLFKGESFSEIGKFSTLSRLCLLRGILTAVPRAVINTHFYLLEFDGDGFGGHGPNGNSVWTILFNGILPELCDYCENPIDSHFNFHVLTVMQICFQQVKTSLSSGLANLTEHYDPLPEDVGSRILRIIWNNLEDPLNQTVKQVHLIFDLFLDVQSSLRSADGSNNNKSFLRKTALYLLSLGARCKGRYVPLASLTKRLGAKYVLEMNPNLLFETIYAYIDDDVCCAATAFLKCFLENLRDECWSSDGIEKGYSTFRGYCLPPILHGLVSGISKLRSNLNTYALSVVLEIDIDSIFPMLDFISCSPTVEDTELSFPKLNNTKIALTVDQVVAALVSLLKVSRSLALIEGDIDHMTDSAMLQGGCAPGQEDLDQFAVISIKGIKVKVLLKWLVLAMTHVDETLRIDAAESLFLNPKTSSLPSHLELSLMKEAVPLNMRCSSTAFQMKWTSLFRKFFSRVRTALERQVKQGHWQPLACFGSNEEVLTMHSNGNAAHKAEVLFHFMRWLSNFLFFSCYPSAPYERKIMAMELILIMSNTWSIAPPSQSSNSASCLSPYSEGFTLPDSTLLLVGSIIDSWDRLRESSFRILLQFPTPLPGISNQDQVKEVIAWAKRLVCSPRVRESDAGALTLRLIFRKYVMELGWIVGVAVDVVCLNPQSKLLNGAATDSRPKYPVVEYILSLIDWLHVAVEEGEKDLSEACKNSFVHGILLSLRYTFEELDWNSDIALSCSSEMRTALGKLLDIVMQITSLALWVVSADAWYLPDDTDDMVGEDALFSDMAVEMTVENSTMEFEAGDLKPVDDTRPTEQFVMVACWLAMKEVSLLLGTITRKIPLPSCTSLDPVKCSNTFEEADVSSIPMSDKVLDFEQLEAMGNHFLEVLLKMKHNGAIDKTRAGFTALCNRLLCSNDPRLCKMMESWMEQLMERTIAKGQTVDDLLRRSAGIPAAFIALFLSEPEGTPKKLLPRALRWLIDVANKSLPHPGEANPPNDHLINDKLKNPRQAPLHSLQNEMNGSEKISKLRDEGVIPTVHAFNVLRAAFNDTNLATDTSGFCAEALIIAICSFSSPYWEVRNSACLAYTALVRRMIGFLNVHKRGSARRALTALEFFHRYPPLHPFLFNELKVATEFLGDESPKDLKSNILKAVHPSLCPVLILLSRLNPSSMSCDTEDLLDPFLFMPLIRRCSTQSNLRIRALASRALTGLVSNEKLPVVLINIASELPRQSISGISISSATACQGARTASFNSIHGMLLQLSSLLDVNCRNLGDVSKKDQILGDLIQVLGMCSWIGSPRLCPCSILNSSYLQVLDHMLAIVRTCRMSKHVDSIRSLLARLSAECLDLKATYGSSYYDPTRSELHKRAAVSYFNCVSQVSIEVAEEGFQLLHGYPPSGVSSSEVPETDSVVVGLPQRLILSISNKSYEVRIASLKWLFQFLRTLESSRTSDGSISDIRIIHEWAVANLQPTLIQLLASENNSRCTCYILRILFVWNMLQFQKPQNQQNEGTIYIGNMDSDAIFLFWDKLISLNKVVRHRKTQQALICCMGLCVKKFTNLFRNSIFLDLGEKKTINCSELDCSEKWVHIYRCICTFIDLIGLHSISSEPVNMRKAAADSMVASGLLEEAAYIYSFVSNTHTSSEEPHSFESSEAANMYASRILDTWFTCIKLLEDEDIGLRENLAKDVQKCFTIEGNGGSTKTDVAALPTQVEKVIESSFEFLSSVFGHWLAYFEYLIRFVQNTSYILSQGDLVRRVFDKEIDNHHEEKLLICQFCCLHLEKLPVSLSSVVELSDEDEVMNFLQKWRKRFYLQLISFANEYPKNEGRFDWIGGAGNHKDVFISLYANLLGLYALSQCLFNRQAGISTPQLADLIELGSIIRPFLKNPVIYNMYLLVVQSHKKMSGVVTDSLELRSGIDSSIWDGFDPYFLLR